jgi:hypothetical protein
MLDGKSSIYRIKVHMKLYSSGLTVIVSTICGLTACSSTQVKSSLPLDLNNTSAIEIAVETDNTNLQADAIKHQAGKNLADWAYPIAPEATLPVSHTMKVLIGTPEHSSTPTGFSFSMGNSDPRAPDFQKADVIPISCRLSAVNQPERSAELNMGFSDSAIIGNNPNLKELADHVSTVCFNLLKEVNWPVKKYDNSVKTGGNSWMPEIRIEQEKPTAAPKAQQPADVPSEPRTVPTAKKESGQEPTPVTKEITKEGRKVYIIHNQGNPITFKFGHERK